MLGMCVGVYVIYLVQACVEVYAEVAACCTMETRYSLLTPAFLKLLRDDSKWVGL